MATVLGLVAAATLYTTFTHNVWEDFLITIHFSQNLVEGHGLVYFPGERVHGFTSVINTLLPALFLFVGDVENYQGALAGYRAVSILALAGGLGVLGYAIYRDRSWTTVGRWLLALFVVLDFKLIAFASNGMETGFLVGFLALGLAAALRDTSRYWLISGLAWAGLMYTRPDSPLYIVLLAGLGIWLRRETWRAEAAGLLKAAAVCTLLYLPWFLWVWSYYGSPVPHTIIAKSCYPTQPPLAGWAEWFNALWDAMQTRGPMVFLPMDVRTSNWWGPAIVVAQLAVPGVLLAGWWAGKDRLIQGLSVIFGCLLLYFAFQSVRGAPFPWYLPPGMFIAGVVLARGLGAAGSLPQRVLRGVCALALLSALIGNWVYGLPMVRAQQSIVEDGNRAEVGRWLKAQASPQDTVFLEPLGYIGYFSRLHMRDYPGLVSPPTVAALRHGSASFAEAALTLQPDWIVLRGHEISMFQNKPRFEATYRLAARFDVRERVRANGPFPGISFPWFDAEYLVFRKQPTDAAPAPLSPFTDTGGW